jgi:hypothetical protein
MESMHQLSTNTKEEIKELQNVLNWSVSDHCFTANPSNEKSKV